jgi:RHS repeat-associated protein
VEHGRPDPGFIGSVANLTSATGAARWTYDYEPFGMTRTEVEEAGGQPTNAMRFTGEYRDPTGLYHLRLRQYAPELGRFLSVDQLDQPVGTVPHSAYAYAEVAPTTRIDPTGLGAVDVASPGRRLARMAATSACALGTGSAVLISQETDGGGFPDWACRWAAISLVLRDEP